MSVLSLQQAKDHLNITSSAYDAELQAMIDSAEALIAKRCGPLVPTAVTSRVQGGTDILILPVQPVISLTSVTPVAPAGQPALDLSTITLDPAGLVSYATWGWFGSWTYDVVYQAGRSSVPNDLLLAIKELVRHLWRSQRGTTGRPASGDQPQVSGFLIPYAVAELLVPHLQVGLS